MTAFSRTRLRRRKTPLSTALVFAVLLVLAVIYIYPFLVQVATSFKTDAEATSAPLSLIPQHFTVAAYAELFQGDFPLWFKNSAVVAVAVTFGRLAFDSMAAYALSRLRFPGREFITAGMIAVMSVPVVVLLIPKFLVISGLGIYDTYAGMILPLLVDAGGIYILKTFFDDLPDSVEEAARLDGAGPIRMFWSVILPMATPVLITIFIMSFQSSWNALNHFIIATQSNELTTLTRGLAQLSSGSMGKENRYPYKLAMAVLMTLPVAVLFFIFQRKIVSTSTGAVKG